MSAYETLLCATARAQESMAGTLTVSMLDLAEVLAELAALRGAAPAVSKYPAEFEEAWALYPKRSGASKVATFKQWKARIKAGASVLQMIEGAAAYATYCRAKGTEDSFIKQPATFFGPGEHYAADWSVRASPAPRFTPQLSVAEQNARNTIEAMRLLGIPDDVQGEIIDAN